MIAPATNLLVYAHREAAPFHAAAFECVRRCAESRSPWALPWPCLHEYFAIATRPRIYHPPTPAAKAIHQIDAWLQSPGVVLLAESPVHWGTLRESLAKARSVGPAVHDARIAALCLQHGVHDLCGRPIGTSAASAR